MRHGRYRFDFYVLGARPVIIEVQGRQHYELVKKFHKSYLDLNAGQERDRRKINYCLAHNIPIYCIPFWEIDNLKTADDIFQEKFRARDQWKNDKDYSNYKSEKRKEKEFDILMAGVL